jgi:hypothetical protein
LRQERVQPGLDLLGRSLHVLLDLGQLGFVVHGLHRDGHQDPFGAGGRGLPVDRSLLPGEHPRQHVAQIEAVGDELFDEGDDGSHRRVDETSDLVRSVTNGHLDGALARAVQA